MNNKILALAILMASAAMPVAATDMNFGEKAPQPVQQTPSAYGWSGFYLGV